MWWEPENENESEIVAALQRLRSIFVEESVYGNIVHSIGSILETSGKRCLLLILDRSFDHRENSIAIEDWARRIFVGFPRNISREFSRDTMMIPLRELPEDVQQVFYTWKLPYSTRVMFAGAPVSLFGLENCQVRVGVNSASIGLMIKSNNPHTTLLTTVGHLAERPMSAASIERKLIYMIREKRRLGTVVHVNDPVGKLGVDISIVEISNDIIYSGFYIDPQGENLLCNSKNAIDLSEGILMGGSSGRRAGWLNGAMTASRGLDGRLWNNCWLMNEFDDGFGRKGDSGSIVMLQGRKMLGHLVAGLGTVRSKGRYQ